MSRRGRSAQIALIALLTLSACIDRWLEAPFVLATGMGEARSLHPTLHEGMWVASAEGLFEVNGNGVTTPHLRTPVSAVAGTPERLFIVDESGLHWGPPPAPGASFQADGGVTRTDVHDLLGWTDGNLLLAIGEEVRLFDARSGTAAPYATGLGAIRALALGPTEGGPSALAVTEDRLWLLRGGERTLLASGLVDAQAAATDPWGRVWILQGAPREIDRVEGQELRRFATSVGDCTDLHFGATGLFPAENLYLTARDGTLNYVRVPSPG